MMNNHLFKEAILFIGAVCLITVTTTVLSVKKEIKKIKYAHTFFYKD